MFYSVVGTRYRAFCIGRGSLRFNQHRTFRPRIRAGFSAVRSVTAGPKKRHQYFYRPAAPRLRTVRRWSKRRTR